jgi:hypothetical protein
MRGRGRLCVALTHLHSPYNRELKLPHAGAGCVGDEEDAETEEGGVAEQVVHEVDDQGERDEGEGPLGGKGAGGRGGNDRVRREAQLRSGSE